MAWRSRRRHLPQVRKSRFATAAEPGWPQTFGATDNAAIIAGIDLTDPESTAHYAEEATRRFGRIDGVVSTVGGFAFEQIAKCQVATWERMFTLNLRSAVNVSQAVLPVMTAQGAGAIVLTGATAALKAPAGLAAYAASKSGVMRLTESLAEEVKHSGITVNCVMPGMIDTPQNRAAMPDADRSGWVDPAAIADVILFLVSEQARAVTGALVPVTGKG